ncbi:MAG TPA: hypothetical protein VFO30_05650 [Chthoniobacterales bacterium]|nr:hypothetical protein [Chthoniobacterales bacterium]
MGRKYASALALTFVLALIGGTSQGGLHGVKIGMYDANAAATMNKGTQLLKKSDYEGAAGIILPRFIETRKHGPASRAFAPHSLDDCCQKLRCD